MSLLSFELNFVVGDAKRNGKGRQHKEYTRALQDSISIATRQLLFDRGGLYTLLRYKEISGFFGTADCYRIGGTFGMGENGGAKSISLLQKIISHTIPDLVLTKVEPSTYTY